VATILLVDDDEQLRTRLARFLERLGYHVLMAADGKGAMTVLAETSVDLVVTDINMPDMDGIEIIMALQEAASSVPVIAMSGGGLFDKEMLLDSAGAFGAVVTLEKPFEPTLLQATIASVLAGGGRAADDA
jgi:two-component system response regulator (stage 0 sporulation protein F)